MEEHLHQIRAAFEASASAEARQAGVLACRALLNALETEPVHPELANVEPVNVEPANVKIAAAPTGDTMKPSPEMAPVSEGVPELCDPREVPPTAAPSPVQPSAPPIPPSPLPASAAVPAASGGIDPAALAAIVTTIRSLSPDQWLDLIIHKLQTAVRAMPTAPAAPMVPTAPVVLSQAAPQPLRFRFVPVPPTSAPLPKVRR